MALSKRNNLKICRYWLKRVCVWIAQKRDEYTAELTAEQLVIIDNLVIACNGFVALVDLIYPPNE
jgi:hypothetical protein